MMNNFKWVVEPPPIPDNNSSQGNEIKQTLEEQQQLRQVIEDLVLNKIGCGVVRITDKLTKISETRLPGETDTIVRHQDLSKKEIIGVILPYKNPDMPEESNWVIIEIDGSAGLIKIGELYQSTRNNFVNSFKKQFSPEGEGVEITGKHEFVIDCVLDISDALKFDNTNKENPVKMSEIVKQASEQALERKKQMYQNIASSRKPIINSLQQILKPPQI